ncbi:MAG: glycosyltransferase [Solirubrobacterales bacterium]|nr:glycosyltransferase [Solirubrobacterales bacterium]
MPGTDVLVVSVGSTSGWRCAADELVAALARAGATVEIVRTGPLPRVRTFALTDFVEARAARRACLAGLARHDPRAIVYCSITASLLWPRPGAIWLDSVAAENRPGRHGIWQRVVERRRLAAATLVLTWSDRALDPLSPRRYEQVVLPPPIEGSAPSAPRDIDAIAYAGDPIKRRLEFVLDTWSRVRRAGETLVVAGCDGLPTIDGVRVAGRVSQAEFRSLLARGKVFVAAPRREDFGISALEALAHGCMLATTPSPGPYPALDLARQLDPRLVDDDLGAAVRAGLDDPAPGYADRAATLLVRFRRPALDQTIARHVLPRLLPALEAH